MTVILTFDTNFYYLLFILIFSHINLYPWNKILFIVLLIINSFHKIIQNNILQKIFYLKSKLFRYIFNQLGFINIFYSLIIFISNLYYSFVLIIADKYLKLIYWYGFINIYCFTMHYAKDSNVYTVFFDYFYVNFYFYKTNLIYYS